MRLRSFVLPAAVLGGLLLLLPVASGAAEIGDLPEDLPQKYRVWLEDVELLLSEEELELFLSLEEDYERDEFIERFWRVRDPDPRTVRNELQDDWEWRLDYARQHFEGKRDDRTRMLLLNGVPDAIIESRCSDLYPVQGWAYTRSEALNHELAIVFYRRHGQGPFRVWHPMDGLAALFDEWAAGARSRGTLQDIALGCPRGEELATVIAWVMQQGAMGYSTLLGRIDERREPPSSEWVKTFDSYSTRLPPGAGTFDAELTLSFPGRRQSRTVTQGLVAVPAAQVGTAELAGSRSYNLVVNGEVLLDGGLFDSFRYKFDFPTAQIEGPTIPLVFERALRPGTYTLVVKVEDLSSGKFHRAEREVEVPEQTTLVAGPQDEATARLLEEANALLAEGETSLRLVRPQGELLTDMVRFNTLTVGDIERVTFTLNGQPVLTDKRPPFSVELDLGTLPRTHSLRATAYDEEGVELASDEILVNSGGTRFRVHLTEPHRGRTYSESLRAAAELEVPAGQDVERLELYLNETKVATLYDPPWSQPIVLPDGMRGGDVMGYVRAVAYLEDGNLTEDTVFINAPDYMEEVDVQLVELFTTVLDRAGRPVDGLTRESFRVFEEGEEQQIRRFEQVRDLPIHAGILMDVSASMAERLGTTQEAAVQFFQQIVRPKDRAALITFNDYPHLAVKFTNEVDALAGGLAGLKAERGTSLWDSVIFSLYYFNGVRGQKALLILSDGEDESSKFGYEEALEYARRAGVTIYSIGLDLPRGPAKKNLAELAEQTGGRSFFIDTADPLAGIYAQIEKELRSQYLIAYQSSSTDTSGAFRSVELEVDRKDLEVKTMTGYYP